MKRRLANFIRMSAFRKGVLGSSRAWFSVWAALGTYRFLKKRLDRDQGVIERVELGAGESVLITDTAIPRKVFKA